MPTSIEDFARLCQAVESTTSRKKKIRLIADFLSSLEPDEVKPAVLLLLGRPLPETDSRKLDVGYATIEKVRSGTRQSTLFQEEVMVGDVLPMLYRIADATGQGSRRNKENLLRNLFGRLSPQAGKYLRRSLYREMRIGASEGVVLEAIALASNNDPEEVKNSNMFMGDIGKLAEVALGGKELKVSTRMFVPIRPMLAETAGSVEEAIEVLGRAAFEFKLDGVRVQVHKEGGEVRIYSRRLTEVTDSLPEVVEIVKRIPRSRLIMEGEVVAYRSRPLPFQDLMRRFQRTKDIEEMSQKVPVRPFLFDILLEGSEPLLELPYEERYNILTSIVPGELLVERMVTSDPEEARDFFDRAIEEGHEGLMAKDLRSPYVMGKRGRKWLKIKRSHTLDLVIVAAEWGYGRRKGWLSDYYLAALEGEEFSVVGKTFKGLTDDEFRWMTQRLLELKVEEEDHVVRVVPKVVVEVAFDEVQTSPKYPSGMALRFARIKSIREDKEPEDADSIDEVKRIFAAQFRVKERLNDEDVG